MTLSEATFIIIFYMFQPLEPTHHTTTTSLFHLSNSTTTTTHPHLLLFACALYIYKRSCLRADRQAGNIIVLRNRPCPLPFVFHFFCATGVIFLLSLAGELYLRAA